jgi:hypothetical protein
LSIAPEGKKSVTIFLPENDSWSWPMPIDDEDLKVPDLHKANAQMPSHNTTMTATTISSFFLYPMRGGK